MNDNRNTHGAKTLDAEFFNSSEVFRLESDRIFSSQWMCVGRVAEIGQSSDYKLCEVNGESLIVLRDHDGQIQCFYNVCRHRGSRLCEAVSGSVGNALVCGYHGWAYDPKGQLIAAPNMNDVDNFDKSRYRLGAVSVAEWEGFILVNLSDEPVPVEETFRPLDGKFQDWSLSELVSVGQRVYEVKANWKLIFQNYNECYHCARVHPRLNSMSAYDTASNDLESGPFLGGPMKLADHTETMSMTGKACGNIFENLSDEDRRRVYYYSIFPTLLISPQPDYVLVHRVERVNVDTTRVICELLFHPSSTADKDFDATGAVQFWDEVNRQDWHVCELSQQGIKSRAYEPGPYSNLESVLAAFDRYYLEQLGEE